MSGENSTHRGSFITKTFSALVVTCALAAFQTAAAQTALDVVCSGCVNSKDISNGSVKSKDVKDGSLTAVDLGDEAGVEFDGGDQLLFLPLGIDTVVRAVSVTAPTAGFVIINASGGFDLGPQAIVICSLTTGSTVESDSQIAGGDNDDHFQFFGMTEGFVVAAGTTTFNLVCREEFEGVVVSDSDMTAIYAPTRY